MTNTSTDLSITWVDLHQTDIMAQTDWHDLASETGADMWFTPNWIDPWVNNFAKRRKAFAGCAFHGGKLIGYLPFVIDNLHPFGVPVQIAQLAGPHPLFGVMRLPINSSQHDAALRKMVTELLDLHRCDGVSLAPISNAHFLAEQVSNNLKTDNHLFVHPDTKPRGHTVIRLPDSFDDYLMMLSRNRRNKYRKTKRVLEEQHGVRTEISIGEKALPTLPDFIKAHEAQWKSKGKLGHFSDWPGSHAFYEELCPNHTKAADARLFLQRAEDDEIVTGLFCFVAGKSCHALVPSRNDNWSHLKLDIGLHAQFERIESLISAGIEIIDSGAGEYDYKASLNGETVEMHRYLMSKPNSVGRFKMAALRHYSDFLNLAFYRIWFNKFAPKLRKKGVNVGPLWRSWIRTRV